MAKGSLLHMEDVVFRFLKEGKRNILDHTSLDIEEGGVTLVMGSSGCGKSTLFSVAAGLYPENGGYLEGGAITLCGVPLSTLDPRERAAYLTMMFQNPDLQFCMGTLHDELAFVLENIATDPKEMEGRIQEAVDLFSLGSLLHQDLGTLSGGEKQKVSLCCLYAMGSRAVVLDEPFANIDPVSAKAMVEILKKMKMKGTTIIAVDHKTDLWLPIVDEIVVLGEGGKVLSRGITPDNLCSFHDLFLQEGLYYPQVEKTAKAISSLKETAVSFQSVTIRKNGEKRHFGRKAIPGDVLLEKVSVTIPKGCITAIVGPSGTGKTTTFLSLLKQHPYEGTITVLGKDLSTIRRKDLYGEMGIVFQNPGNQFITQNVAEEVKAGIRLWKKDLGEEKLQKRAEALLEDYGLYRYRRYSPYMLSQGQQRRLAVLSVLSGRQEILLLDEPTYGQDYRSTSAIMAQLVKKVEETGLTVILITHDRELAHVWADKILALEDHKLVEVNHEA